MSRPLVHYPELLERSHAAAAIGIDDFDREDGFQSSSGRRYAYGRDQTRGVLEVVELHRDVLLILEHCTGSPAGDMSQLIGDGRWMHIQFRLNGAGAETLDSNHDFVDVPEATCFIAAYPHGTVIERRADASPVQKTACLYMRPEMMRDFFRVPVQAMPDHLNWTVDGVTDVARSHASPLLAAGYAAVNDMLTSSFRSHARTAFMQAKSTELIAVLLESLNSAPPPVLVEKISLRDARSIMSARELMHDRMTEPLTLEALAAAVGLNRSKLAAGFKEMFGVGVQTYWRDVRLSAARDMLRSDDLSVTEVAARLGYGEISSFTRAFTNKYGVSPSALRSNAAGAVVALERQTSRWPAA